MNLFHKLLNPHCPECKQEEVDRIATQIELNSEARAHELQLNDARLKNQIEMNRCYSCEVLERQLSEANSIIRGLITKPEEQSSEAPTNFKPIAGKRWAVIQRELESKDKELAKTLKESRLNEISVSTLEDELAKIKPNA